MSYPCPSLPCLWHYLNFLFTPVRSSLRIWILSSHVLAYIVGFRPRFQTRKSDIIQPHYELFNACGGSCPSLPCLWHYLSFHFTPVSSSLRIWIFSSHVLAYIVSFQDLKLENPISYDHAIKFLLHVVAHVSHDVVFYTTFAYLFIHSSHLEFRNLHFFILCCSLHRKLWFKIWNLKIRFHTAKLWAF